MKEYIFLPIAIVVSIFFIVLLNCVCCVHRKRRPERAPPGPNTSPIIGNRAAMFTKNSVKIYDKYRKQYGDIFSLFLGRKLVTILNGYDTIHVALVKNGERFHTRPVFAYQLLTQGDEGLIFGDDLDWPVKRQFLLEGFHKFALENEVFTMNDRIRTEVDDMLSDMFGLEGRPIQLDFLLEKYLGNFMFGILFGERFKGDDDNLELAVDGMREVTESFWNGVRLLEAYPWMINVPGDFLNINKYAAFEEEKKKIFKTKYEKYLLKHENGSMENMLDYFIAKNWESPDVYTLDFLYSILIELVSSVLDPCTEAIKWFFLHLLHDPGLQEKLQSDIDRVLGWRRPSLNDREELGFIRATILEILRLRNPMPFALPYTVNTDVDFLGYVIPANSVILPNLMSIFMDPGIFPDPEKFRPERFLTSDGKIQAPTEFIPFSVGHRACLGQSMARMLLFIFITSMLQKFRFEPADIDDIPGFDEGSFGQFYRCPNFKLRMIDRRRASPISVKAGCSNAVVEIERF